ncbi:hypothetical protein CMQ_2231 [Grosmannia clavigera kw1407]|uniref:Uncharacterized protein n=1 Tax=Grosmannia clavigera (strain kw1407 / UAMH 11150) TaxID=655863 RepID=F0XJV3_GROCL|nr:uncharacterized protein CMQ_2231 [Grosmannia clavigera kw1407]EFX02182.1 hypothetical protein CMQ_2231 [Grosmannia clavigera kw1407]
MPSLHIHLPSAASRQPASPSPSSRHPIVSANSTTSTASTSSSVALRRFWSPSPSSPASPTTSAQTQTQSAPSSLHLNDDLLSRIQQSRFQPESALFTLIPPLVDAAAGTTVVPASSIRRLLADLCWLARHLPAVLSATAEPTLHTVLHIALTVGSATLLLWTPLLLACLPGCLFIGWLVTIGLGARLASAPLNTALPAVFHSPWASEDDADVEQDEHWFFVSGIGISSGSLAVMMPRLAAVFGRPITLIRPGRSYGVFLDLARAFLHRLDSRLPVSGADALHSAVRQSLRPMPSLSSSTSSRGRRVVILAHNAGAIAVSQALARLLVDVPPAWLARLEIYTFSSLASDFALPAGFSTTTTPHVEHFALADDPFARFGILRTVREDLSVRCCGGVFVLGESGRPRTPPLTISFHSSRFHMEDYLTTLFGPEPWSMRPDIHEGGAVQRRDTGLLDAVVTVDRDLAEKREMHALVQAAPWPSTRNRLSWTGLGATAAVDDTIRKRDDPSHPYHQQKRQGILGILGLETARRLCRDYNNRPGRAISRLFGHYADAVVRHEERYGPRGML